MSMKHKKLFAAVAAAVLCFTGMLAGCEAGTFDKVEQAYLSCPAEGGSQTALLRRSEETELVDRALSFVKDVPFEALDEAEAEALWEKLLAETDDAAYIIMLFYPEEGDPLPGLDSTAATGFPDGYRSVFVYEDGSAVLSCDNVTYIAAAGEADFAAIAAFIAENG